MDTEGTIILKINMNIHYATTKKQYYESFFRASAKKTQQSWSELLQSKEFQDITLICQDDEQVRANKFILAGKYYLFHESFNLETGNMLRRNRLLIESLSIRSVNIRHELN